MDSIFFDIKKFNTRFPKSNEQYISNLNNAQLELYFKYYKIYSNILYKYLIKKLELKKFDDMLLNSGLQFKQIEREFCDLYQFLSLNYLKYFYVRNNIYIENLSQYELSYLSLINEEQEINQSIENFIETTIPKVLFENLHEKDQIRYINYGPENMNYIKPTNALIIGVRFDEYYKTEKEDDNKWLINNTKQECFLSTLIKVMENHFKNNFNFDICIVRYNDFSVNNIQNSVINSTL